MKIMPLTGENVNWKTKTKIRTKRNVEYSTKQIHTHLSVFGMLNIIVKTKFLSKIRHMLCVHNTYDV